MPEVPPMPTGPRAERVVRGVALLVMVIAGTCLPAVGRDGRVAANEAVRIHLPIVAGGPAAPPPALNEQYDTLSIEGQPEARPAATHPDLNLAVRGYEAVDERRGLVDYGGDTDGGPPQLAGLLGRAPVIRGTYRVYDWDWGHMAHAGPIAWPPVTLITLAAERDAVVRVPGSGYAISAAGHQVLVLYADTNRITLKYTREDSVVGGYTLHVDNVRVAPDLLALYHAANDAGRRRLPALRAGQAFGWAAGGAVGVAIRDEGSFMDPRSRKDWWQGY